MRAVTRELLVFFVLISTIAVLGALAVEHVEPRAPVAADEDSPIVLPVTLGGVRLGWPKSLAQGRLKSASSLVTYAGERVAHVDGDSLEVCGRVVLRARQPLEEAVRLFGPPEHAGFVDGNPEAPAVRYERYHLTVFLIPGTRLIATFHLSQLDDVKRAKRSATSR